jgi:GntR family carbon starvation induced transcriptional regulator
MTEQLRKQTKAASVLENIRQDIMSGYFAPDEKLQMDELKQRYGVGYSPIREALSRLSSFGLVNQEDQVGFKTSPISLSELYDLYQMRKHIDALALQLALEHGDDKWEADILASWHQYEKFLQSGKLDPARWDELQRQFLYCQVKACNSPWLLKIRDMLYDQSERYRSFCLNANNKNKKFIREFIDDNRAFVQALLARNEKKVIQLSNKGWDDSVTMIEKVLRAKKLI